MTFLQVTRPDGKPETLGLVVLDEPMAKQSDPTGTLYTVHIALDQDLYIQENNTV